MSAIIPPYLAARARVAVIFARHIQHAEQEHDQAVVTLLEGLRGEVLAAITAAEGGDALRQH